MAIRAIADSLVGSARRDPRPRVHPGVGNAVKAKHVAMLAAGALALAVGAGCTSEPRKMAVAYAFVGSEKCGTCHVSGYKTRKGSLHAKMVRPRNDGILKDVVASWPRTGPIPGRPRST